MENLIYRITNEIKGLDEYVKAMKKVENREPKKQDLENLQMHISNLKAWAGLPVDASDNSLHKHIVTASLPPIYSEDECRNMLFDYAQFVINAMDGKTDSMPVGVWFDKHKKSSWSNER